MRRVAKVIVYPICKLSNHYFIITFIIIITIIYTLFYTYFILINYQELLLQINHYLVTTSKY